MSNLMGMLTTIQSYVWGPPTLLLLIGTGLYFTIKLRGLQITKFPRAVRAIFEKESGTESGEGDVSAFATLCTTMAADIGTGLLELQRRFELVDRDRYSGCGFQPYLVW